MRPQTGSQPVGRHFGQLTVPGAAIKVTRHALQVPDPARLHCSQRVALKAGLAEAVALDPKFTAPNSGRIRSVAMVCFPGWRRLGMWLLLATSTAHALTVKVTFAVDG